MMQVNKVLNDFEIVGTQYSKKEETQEARKPFIKGIPVLSAVILVLIVMGCLFCELIMTHDPSRMFLDEISMAPGSGHIFGTDTLGRDIWSMIWFGGRKSLIIGTVATIISSFIAIVYGTLSGIAGETVDNIMMRFTEILLSIPSILLVVFMQAALGQRNVLGISVIIGITSWMGIAKIVRAEVRKIRSEEYVLISKMMGGSFMHVLFKHLAPNFMSSIMFMIVMSVRSAIVSESTLSFLGIGLPVEIITWGSMLSLSEKALLTSSWWIILIPGIFLVVTLLCITDIGNYIRGCYNSKEGNL